MSRVAIVAKQLALLVREARTSKRLTSLESTWLIEFEGKIADLIHNMDQVSRTCLQNGLFIEMARIKKVAAVVLHQNAKLGYDNRRLEKEIERLGRVKTLSETLKSLIDEIGSGHA